MGGEAAALHRSQNLELHVVDHCNLDCVGCSHESPLMRRRFEDVDRLAQSLIELWRWYRAPLVKLLGGEPLLHPDIAAVIAVARRVTGATVRLVTNGTLLARRAGVLRGIDEIHISSYPAATIPNDGDLLQLAADIGASITIQDFDAFRWHRTGPRQDPRLTDRIFAACQLYHSWHCHTLRDGWFYPCPPAALWGDRVNDGVDLLSPTVEPRARIDELLGRERPLSTCERCLGSAGGLFPHRLGWRRERGPRPAPDVDHAFLRTLETDASAYNGCYAYRRTLHPTGRVEVHSVRPDDRRSRP